MSTGNNQKSEKKKEFGARFHKFRVDKGLSQRSLAKNLKFTANTQISKFEKGLSEPSAETLRELSRIYAVDLHWLITGQVSPDLKILAAALKGPAQQHLAQLSQTIREKRKELISCELGSIFRDEENQDKIKKLQADIEGHQAEYDKLSSIILLALKDHKKGDIA